jgi:hypothetical protein
VTAKTPLFVPFETIILFSKQTVGKFNIAGGDSQTLASWGVKANITNVIYGLQVTAR